jgi:hypothetical protein
MSICMPGSLSSYWHELRLGSCLPSWKHRLACFAALQSMKRKRDEEDNEEEEDEEEEEYDDEDE